jgi:hypothetical protein
VSALGRTRSARQYLMMALEGLLRDEACALAKVAPPSRATQETADNLYLAWRSYAAQVDGQKPDGLEPINEHLIKMVELFADEGHSGFSAGYAINALTKLLQFERTPRRQGPAPDAGGPHRRD